MDENIVNANGIYGYDAGGIVHLNTEQMAYGLGLTREQTINGAQYTGVRWRRVDKYLKDLGFPDKWGKGLFETYGNRPEFIPENIFTRMAMKTKSQKANDFHAWVMNEVVPHIRKPVVSAEPVSVEPVTEYTEAREEHTADEIQVFTSPIFGQVRLIPNGDKTLFCGVDIARPLGYAKPHNAIQAHCPHALKRGIGVQTGTKADGSPAIQQIEMAFIPEGDVYRLIARSKLPEAQKFESWIFDEVLPSIRKHGAYATPKTVEQFLNDPDFAIRLFTELKNERGKRIALEADNAKLTAQIEADAPRVQWAKTAEGSKTGTLIREFVKFLPPLGVNIGEKRMFEDLRNNGYLIRAKGRDRNKPTQKSMELGLFTVREVIVARPDGTTDTYSTPLLTEKGKQYFTDWYLKRNET